jgi:hypothetical protein
MHHAAPLKADATLHCVALLMVDTNMYHVAPLMADTLHHASFRTTKGGHYHAVVDLLDIQIVR